MEAVRARTFVDSVGINIHPSWRRTIWQTGDWQSALIELGVGNVRGLVGSGPGGSETLGRLQRLFANGIKLCAPIAPHSASFDLRSIGANIDFLAKTIGARSLCGIESANEYNSPPRPRDWAIQLRHFQAWLHETVRAKASLAAVPVVGPSLWRAVTDDVFALGDLEPYVDKACMHYYTGGRRPTLTGKPPTTVRGPSNGEYSLEDAMRQAKTQAPSERIFATEFGYAIAAGKLAPSPFFITEAAAANYLVRGLMDLFAAGVEKTFIYSLVDDVHRDPPRYHGLLDGSLKPRKTFFAIRNFLHLLRDTDSAFTPDPLDVRLTKTPSLKSTLFQKSDRSYLLALYRDVDSYDRARKVDTIVAPATVTLRLPRPASRIDIFAPTAGSTPRHSATHIGAVDVTVSDDVTAVKIFM